MNAIGTLEWARASGGRLTGRERVALTTRGMAAQLRQMSDWAAFRLGVGRDRLLRLDLDSVRVPDSAAAKRAEEVLETLPPYMRHHSHRSYLWAYGLGKLYGVSFDEELLYVCSLLHDAGLYVEDGRAPDECFTLASAHAAAGCAEAGGWETDRREHAMEAITLHINPDVAPEQDVEASLLTRGSTMDVIALRGAWRIEPSTKSAVLARHPRENAAPQLVPVLKGHGKQAPRCRIAFYLRYGGLGQMVLHGPWDD